MTTKSVVSTLSAMAVMAAIPAAVEAASPTVTLAMTEAVGGTIVDARLNAGAVSHTSTTYSLLFTGPAGPARAGEDRLTMPAGAAVVGFRFRTEPVAQALNATVCVSLQPPACEASATLRILPPRLVSFTFAATAVASGNPFQAEVNLDGPAPPGGFVVDLAQSPAPGPVPTGLCPRASVPVAAPDSVLIAQGQRARAFAVPTYFFDHDVDGPLQVLLVARAAGIEKSQTLTVERLRFASASISPASGVKPLNAMATFSLNGPAPVSFQVGATRQPSAPSGATVTGGTTVSAGQQSGSFPVVVDIGGVKGTIPPIEAYIVGQCSRDRLLGVVQLFAPP